LSTRVPTGETQPQGPGEDPLLYYTRVFARFLQVYFATFPKGSYQWSEDDKNTDIVIKGEGSIASEVVERRPAIVVSRGPVGFGNISMDQFKGFDFQTGRRDHTDLLSASVTYQCLSKSGLEAQRIAWAAAYITRVEKRTLAGVPGIHRVGEELQIGAESPPGSVIPSNPREIIMVPVSVPFYFQQNWSTEPRDKVLLKQIGVTVRSEAAYPAPGAVAIKDPGRSGRVLTYSKKVSFNSGVKMSSLITPRPRRK
jgi:hypothetical protein